MRLLFFAAVCASAQTPNLSGVWEADRFRIKIDQQGSEVTVTMRVTNNHEVEELSQKFLAGGETKGMLHGGAMTSHSEWDGGVFAVRSTVMYGSQELKMNDRWSLSADGNTLTFRSRHQFAKEPEKEDVTELKRDRAGTWGPLPPPPAAEVVYKNIQVLKGVPAPRLREMMNEFRTALGVQCGHCHAGPFDKDDKAAKVTARGMVEMVHRINDAGVTCWTCHRGSVTPEKEPVKK